MGPEPLGEDFSAEGFVAALARRAAGIKTVLLSQRVVAGVGNIYADEVLWRTRIHPERKASTLTRREALDLHAQIGAVLAEAIADGGTTLRDYRQVDGGTGHHQEVLGVYGRAGLPCPRCSEVLERLVVGQRGTTFCPVCQPRARRARRRA
jgi:formamidopyrimidine-DNA glycosylase